MNKNITVLDMQGKVCGATYPRRAKGLVKKGRARFAGENTICLVRPPHRAEDIRMDQIQTGNIAVNESPVSAPEMMLDETVQPDVSCLVQAIGQIAQNTDYLTAALQQLENLDGEAAAAAARMVECREQTNQRMIEMLEKMMGKLSI